MLKIKLEVRGKGTKGARNNIEWESLAVNRLYQVEFPLIMQTVSAFDPLAGLIERSLEEHIEDENTATAENEYADMAAAMEMCNGDTACLIETGKKFADGIASGQRQMPKLLVAEGNFATWGLSYDTKASCKGKSIIADRGQGVAIDPPKPAHNYTYIISGEGYPISVDDCVVTLSYDVNRHTYSFSLPSLGSVDVIANISWSGDELRRVNFLDDLESISGSNGGILLSNIKASSKGGFLEGRQQLQGSVSYLFTQDVVPVTAELSWRFEVE
ncbi:hypothetical protein GCM10010919_07620 [Alishewanella longhuensis]|uniref:Tail fiber protein n=1 Tax=Alishewanella longhuensis TaxID=1091037 RepID=A0ABQ3L3J2_9ALTE|nr:hypothetical protein GCM10010919_07620 [Alishewanella longhuensis]